MTKWHIIPIVQTISSEETSVSMTYKYLKSGLLDLSGGGPLCFMESVRFVYIVPGIRQKQYQSAMGGMFQHPLFWNAARISTDVARRKNICYQFPGVLRARFLNHARNSVKTAWSTAVLASASSVIRMWGSRSRTS